MTELKTEGSCDAVLERASAALSPLAGNGYLAYEVADVPLPELDATEEAKASSAAPH